MNADIHQKLKSIQKLDTTKGSNTAPRGKGKLADDDGWRPARVSDAIKKRGEAERTVHEKSHKQVPQRCVLAIQTLWTFSESFLEFPQRVVFTSQVRREQLEDQKIERYLAFVLLIVAFLIYNNNTRLRYATELPAVFWIGVSCLPCGSGLLFHDW